MVTGRPPGGRRPVEGSAGARKTSQTVKPAQDLASRRTISHIQLNWSFLQVAGANPRPARTVPRLLPHARCLPAAMRRGRAIPAINASPDDQQRPCSPIPPDRPPHGPHRCEVRVVMPSLVTRPAIHWTRWPGGHVGRDVDDPLADGVPGGQAGTSAGPGTLLMMIIQGFRMRRSPARGPARRDLAG